MNSYTVPEPLYRLANSLRVHPMPSTPTVVSTITKGPAPGARTNARRPPNTPPEKTGPTARDWATQSTVLSCPPASFGASTDIRIPSSDRTPTADPSGPNNNRQLNCDPGLSPRDYDSALTVSRSGSRK